MARISLRASNREIETLIEKSQHDQAIALCRHILQYFPKHVDTYRLLGKAFLENQRYGDAADIFQRVLSSIPDDFVSHVGMSIIREDEGNLDASIFHMERAFDIQPANAAIQNEMRRLLGKRDRFEPPKVRLTRGALARMYVKGDLYPQAITELRAALAEDPQRLDLQILLARAYQRSNQVAEAASLCNGVLSKLPFCLEANLILYEIFTHSDRTSEADVYRQIIQSLNPYFAHISPHATSADKVADEAITIQKLDWKPGQTPPGADSQPQWVSSLGMKVDSLETGQESLPDWLKDASPEEESVFYEKVSPFGTPPTQTPQNVEGAAIVGDELSTETSESGESLPDWMKDAGWSSSNGLEDETSSVFDLEMGDEQLEELSPAEIPDWLQAIAPLQPAAGSPEDAVEPDSLDIEIDSDALSWLDETSTEPSDSIMTWLEKKEVTEPETDLSAEIEFEPASQSEQPEPEAEQPDWLKGLTDYEEEGTAGSEPEEIPDWLSALSPVSSPEGFPGAEDELLEVEAGEQPEIAAMDEPPVPGMPELEPEAEQPDWLKEEASLEEDLEVLPAVEFETLDLEEVDLAEPAIEAAELPDWLQEEEMQGEALELKPVQESEPSEWQPEEILDQFAPEELAAAEAETETAPPSFAEISQEDEDAAFAWLEGLAAKQGTDEAMLLSPEERLEEPPDWVKQASETVDEGFQAPIPADVDEEQEPAMVAEELEELAEPTWSPEEPVAAEAGIIEDGTDEDDLRKWLAELATTPETEPEPIEMQQVEPEQVEADEEEAPEVVAEIELPDWLGKPEEDIELIEFQPVEAEAFEEAPIIEGDTKPTRIVLADDILPDAQPEVAPEWAEELVVEETPQELEAIESPGELEMLAEEDVSVEPVPEELPGEQPVVAGMDDEDADFAWLESLAVRQGADEALLLKPEERLEEAPEWVQQAVAEEAAAQEQAAMDEAPETLDIQAEEAREPIELDEFTKLPVPPVTADEPELETEAAISETMETVTADVEGIATDLDETTAMAEAFDEETPPEEEAGDIPELPDWLAVVDEEAEEEIPWLPPDEVEIEADAVEAELEQPFEEPGESVEIQEGEPVVEETHLPAAPEAEPVLDPQAILLQARNAIIQGNIDEALEKYTSLITKGEFIPEVTQDLVDALYRYPVDILFWQALGDAHLRANKLQDALDAYTKAEELIR